MINKRGTGVRGPPVVSSLGRRHRFRRRRSGGGFRSGRTSTWAPAFRKAGRLAAKSRWAPTNGGPERGDGKWTQVNPTHAILLVPSSLVGPQGPPEKRSPYRKQRTDPLVSAEGDPRKHVRASAGIAFPLDEEAQLPSDLVAVIEFIFEMEPEKLAHRLM